MNTYTVYLQNGLWGVPVIQADEYLTKHTELGLCAKFYRDNAIIAEFVGVLGIVQQSAFVIQPQQQNPFGAFHG